MDGSKGAPETTLGIVKMELFTRDKELAKNAGIFGKMGYSSGGDMQDGGAQCVIE